MKSHIEVIARAVILREGKLLLCSVPGQNWAFLPGGHIDFGESAEAALIREIKEELGMEADVKRFLGAIQNSYKEEEVVHHELNLIFLVELKNPDSLLVSKESHITFQFLNIGEIDKIILLPAVLKESLLEWLCNPEAIFWR